MQHLIIDHNILEVEWHLRLDLVRHRLIQLFAIAERQEQRAQRYEVPGEGREHGARFQLVVLQETPHLLTEGAGGGIDRLTMERHDAVIPKGGFHHRGFHFVRIYFQRENTLRHSRLYRRSGITFKGLSIPTLHPIAAGTALAHPLSANLPGSPPSSWA